MSAPLALAPNAGTGRLRCGVDASAGVACQIPLAFAGGGFPAAGDPAAGGSALVRRPGGHAEDSSASLASKSPSNGVCVKPYRGDESNARSGQLASRRRGRYCCCLSATSFAVRAAGCIAPGWSIRRAPCGPTQAGRGHKLEYRRIDQIAGCWRQPLPSSQPAAPLGPVQLPQEEKEEEEGGSTAQRSSDAGPFADYGSGQVC